MDYLTYPFHDPSLLAIIKSGKDTGTAPPAIDDSDDQERLAISQDPLIRRSGSNNNDTAGNNSSSYSSLAFVDEDQASISSFVDSTGDNEDDQSLAASRHRTPSNLSTSSSQYFIQHHNAAFQKLRTANTSTNNADIPVEWKGYEPPSLTKGHWRSFGPTEVVLTVVDEELSPPNGETYHHHPHHTHHNTSTGNYRHVKKRLENGKNSSLWKGTIWLTTTHLIFILAKDEVPEKVDPADLHDTSHTENWVTSIRRMLGHGHRGHSEDAAGVPAGDFPPTIDPDTGYPITAFQVPLSALLNVKLKPPSARHRGRGSTKRNSVASSSTGGFLSPPGSTPISPALSRIQTRNTRSPSRQGQGQLSRSQSRHRNGSPGDTLVPANEKEDKHHHHHQRQLPSEQSATIDFGALINRQEDPYTVILYSENQKNAAKVEFRFMSGLYVDEAKDLVERLKAFTQKK